MSKCKNCRCPFENEPPSNCRGPTIGSIPLTSSDKIPPTIISPDGVIVGYIRNYPKMYCGLAYKNDGHMLVTGANGSGKSRHIAKTTLTSWQGPLLVLDVKGELFLYYDDLFKKGLVKYKPILLDPNSEYGLKYDPLRNCNTISEYSAIVYALIPEEDNSHNMFWIETERNMLTASFIFYHELGLSFYEIIVKVINTSARDLCEDILNGDCEAAKGYIKDIPKGRNELTAEFGIGLRSKLADFATDPMFEKVFSFEDGDSTFTWDDLNHSSIFIHIPEENIAEWSAPLRLIFSQLFRYLMTRADKHSEQGKHNPHILLLLDEFARIGKIELFIEALTTLRSRNVNICVMIQSLAQLDMCYGVEGRRVICDNCQYKAILSVYDTDTQKYFSDLIGTTIVRFSSTTDTENYRSDTESWSTHYQSKREPVVYPHELAFNNHVLFLSPDGFYCLEKAMPDDIIQVAEERKKRNLELNSMIRVEAIPADMTVELTPGVIVEEIQDELKGL